MVAYSINFGKTRRLKFHQETSKVNREPPKPREIPERIRCGWRSSFEHGTWSGSEYSPTSRTHGQGDGSHGGHTLPWVATPRRRDWTKSRSSVVRVHGHTQPISLRSTWCSLRYVSGRFRGSHVASPRRRQERKVLYRYRCEISIPQHEYESLNHGRAGM